MNALETQLLRTLAQGGVDLPTLAQSLGVTVEALADTPPDSPLYAKIENLARLFDAATELARRMNGPAAVSQLLHLTTSENHNAAVRAALSLLEPAPPPATPTPDFQLTAYEDPPVLADFAQRYQQRLLQTAQTDPPIEILPPSGTG